ncbi:MAG: helix-turn-helix domain-containing protein [Gammaproteobacteria bacterium]|jgi:DNA-binding HxlR family transcriptional regulator
MYDYNEACPISMAASVLCERWTLQIIREMFFGSTRYSEIRKFIPNISPSLLRDRLRFLEEQGLIVRKRAERANRYEYFLTPSGKALAPVLTEMGKWGMRYANEGMTDKVNTASGLVRDFAGRLNTDELPSGNTSIQINLADVEKTPAGYIHVRDGQVQVCDTDLGFETDVVIDSTLDLMTRVWYGEIDMGKAVQSGRMNVSARPLYCRHLTRWLRISSFTTDNPSFGD